MSDSEATLLLFSDASKSSVPDVDEAASQKRLTTGALVIVMFFLVCGGSYGTEDLIGCIPPFFALLMILLIPWVWSVPVGLIAAELSLCCNNSAKGFFEWSLQAFGNLPSQVHGCIVLYVLLLDQSIYPKIFVSYTAPAIWGQETYEQMTLLSRVALAASFVLVGLVVTFFGLDLLEKVTKLLFFVTVTPFVLFGVVGFSMSHFDASVWFETSGNEGTTQVSLFLSVLIWATCGFEWSGALAANTLDPRTSFPRALSLSVLIMTSVYLLPLLVSFGVYPAYSTVTEGFYPVIARSLGAGEWLPLTLVLGAATSSLGTYCSYLFASSSVIRGVTGWNQRACIVLLSTAALLLTPFDFAALVELEAFIDWPRPFKVPGGWPGAIVCAVLPSVVATTLIVWNEFVIIAVGVASLITIMMVVAVVAVVRRRRRTI